jgi:hypothetical protein
MKTVLLTSVAAIGIVAFGSTAAYSQESLTCNAATVAGTYSVRVSGFSGTAAPFTPVAAVATRTFDGVGKFSGAGYQTTGGTSVAFTTSGTYKVTSTCTIMITGAITTGGSNTQFGVISDNGNTIHAVRLDKGYTDNIDYERIAQ